MKKQTFQRAAWLVLSVLLVLPSFYFVVSALLKQSFGISSAWTLIERIFNEPENKKLGLNINLVILFGPLLSLIFSTLELVHWHVTNLPDRVEARFNIAKHSWSWIPCVIALFCLGSLSLYLFAENIKL